MASRIAGESASPLLLVPAVEGPMPVDVEGVVLPSPRRTFMSRLL